MSTYLNVKETADLLKTTPARLYNSICKKEIPTNIFVRFGRKILFKQDAIINWLEKGDI